MKNILISVAVSVAVVAAGYLVVPRVVEITYGASGTGQDTASRQFFQQGSTEGGIVSTTTAGVATYTTDARDFYNTPTVVSWLPNLNITVSLSSTSTLAYVPKVGDVANIYVRNASTTAGSSITFAAKDSGLDLQFAEATGGDLVLNGLDWAKLTIIHTSQNLVTVIFDEMTEAD